MARYGPPLTDQAWQPFIWCLIVIVDFAGALAACRCGVVPVSATPAVRPIPTLNPAKMISSRFIRKLPSSFTELSTLSDGAASECDLKVHAGLPQGHCGFLRTARSGALCRLLPALESRAGRGRREPDAGVDYDAAGGERNHRIKVELGHLGQLLGEQRKPVQQVDQRRRIGCRCPAEAGDEPPGLALLDELVRIDVCERSDPEDGGADQLREDAAGTEGDEGAEDRILDDARKQLGTAGDHRLHEDRRPDAFRGGAN